MTDGYYQVGNNSFTNFGRRSKQQVEQFRGVFQSIGFGEGDESVNYVNSNAMSCG